MRAAARLQEKETLSSEGAALESDQDDRAETLAVAELMKSLYTPD